MRFGRTSPIRLLARKTHLQLLVVAEEGRRRRTLNIFIAPVGDVERGEGGEGGATNSHPVQKSTQQLQCGHFCNSCGRVAKKDNYCRRPSWLTSFNLQCGLDYSPPPARAQSEYKFEAIHDVFFIMPFLANLSVIERPATFAMKLQLAHDAVVLFPSLSLSLSLFLSLPLSLSLSLDPNLVSGCPPRPVKKWQRGV
jgi:hypothetical protein